MAAAVVVPSLWSAVHRWFTPAVLFVLINLVIATIAVASRSTSAAGSGEPGNAEGRGALLRAPSFTFDRLRSFSFSRLPATEPFGGEETEPSLPLAAELEREEESEHGHEQVHIERSRSEAAAGEAPAPRVPARMRRSASEMSASAHFAPAAEEEVVAVEARRPATAKDAAGGGFAHHPAAADDDNDDDDDEEPPPPPVEVDARADDFIRQFREQLRLQRLDSVLRRRDMLRRGHHAGGTG